MRILRKALTAILALCMMMSGCAGRQDGPGDAREELPGVKTPETVRAVWLSYLELDRALTGATAQAAGAYIDGVMERCAASGINTVFFHVRAHSDAYYRSELFPAAESAAGLIAAGFDPLQCAVEAAHKRGIALHAWVNPYRVGDRRDLAVCGDVFELDGIWYYIPTSKEAQRCILQGVRELISRYAIDGVQYDDYFYPAAIGEDKQAFEQPAGTLSVAVWRRAAVSALVAATYSAVHSRENCVFGISPAGNIARCTDRQYADVARWLRYPGYVDYLCPQLYSGFDNESLPFEEQMRAFLALPRAEGVRLYAGLALYKAGAVDAFAGDGSAEWQNGGDLLARQAQMAEEAGYTGAALFRFAFWEPPTEGEETVRASEISALISYFSK